MLYYVKNLYIHKYIHLYEYIYQSKNHVFAIQYFYKLSLCLIFKVLDIGSIIRHLIW